KASLSPAMRAWIAQHPQEWNESLKAHNLSQPYPSWDAPHIEWAGPLSERQLAANRANINRAQVDRVMTHNVKGNASIDVNVNAPRGTAVSAAGSGLFNKVNVNREIQMEPTATSSGMAGPG